MRKQGFREMSVGLATFALVAAAAAAEYNLELVADPAEAGTVAAYPGVGAVEEGALVTVTATPAEGYEFVGWEGDIIAAESSVTFTMTDDTSLTAVFAEAAPPQYTLTAFVDPSGAGSIVRDPADFTYAEGTSVTLTAYPADGYTFTGWYGDVPSGVNPNLTELTVEVTGDLDIEARFAAAQALDDDSSAGTATGTCPTYPLCGLFPVANLGLTLSLLMLMRFGRPRR